MTTQTSFKDGVLVVTRTYAAAREDVFDAWIDASKVRLWWGCADTTECESRVAARVGGAYRHKMTLHGTHEHEVHGLITEYDPPRRLAYDIADPRAGETMSVSVDFLETAEGTQVRLVHAGVPDGFDDIITGGWRAAFEKLAGFLASASDAA